MLRYLTSGESHGQCMLAILDGMPSDLKIDESVINGELSRRMAGYGRGGDLAENRELFGAGHATRPLSRCCS